MVPVAVAGLSCESCTWRVKAEGTGLGWRSGQDIVGVRDGRTEGQAGSPAEWGDESAP